MRRYLSPPRENENYNWKKSKSGKAILSRGILCWYFWKKYSSYHSKPVCKSLKKSTNGPADEVTPNLKTENGTDFHETNGKHTKNHENGIENNHQDQKSNDHQSDDDLEESIDLTDKVRNIYIYAANYESLWFFIQYITDKMRRNEINESICEVSNLCSRSSWCRF